MGANGNIHIKDNVDGLGHDQTVFGLIPCATFNATSIM